MKKRSRLSILLLLTFLVGTLTGTVLDVSAFAKDSIYAKLEIFAKVLHYVETNYVEEVDQDELIHGAIKGMLDKLDPHTVFMPPDIYREMKIDTSGEFQGLGLIVESRDNRLVVVSPIDGSPAYKAGFKRGDEIVAINDTPTMELSLHEATNMMRGRIGTKVELTVRHANSSNLSRVTLTRARIRSNSVDYKMLSDNIGYIRVSSFQDRTTTQVVAALKTMMVNSGGPLKGVVLDLRNNPGGLFEEAVHLADEFVSEGTIVSTKGRSRTHEEIEKAHKSGNYLKGKMVVLINGGSASSSEIVAGALQDLKRAVIMGTQSFGKGSVQNIIDLDDGSGLKLTVARYFTPDKRSIDMIGITPDVLVAQPEYIAQLMNDTEAMAQGFSMELTDERGMQLMEAVDPPSAIETEDHQLRAAYSYLILGKLP